MDGRSLGHVIMIVAVAIFISYTLRRGENPAPKDDPVEKPPDVKEHAPEKAEIVSEPKNDTDDAALLEPKNNPVEDAVIWFLRWFILKPLFWIAYIGFFIGSLAALFAAIANIIHFNILAAVGFYLLYMLLWAIWKQLEYHRILTKLWREAFSSGISKNFL